MTLKICELVSIILSAVVGGMYWGPWLALSRSFGTFEPEIFLPIVHRMNKNMAPLMPVLTVAGLLSVLPVLFITYSTRPEAFYFTLAGLALFIVAVLVTVIIEVPIVKQMLTWTVPTLPDNWQELRDRWMSFHVVRVLAGIIGLTLIVIGALFWYR